MELDRVLLGYYIFARLDAVSDGDLSPETLSKFIFEYETMDQEEVIKYLKSEYNEDDLPLHLKTASV